MMPRLARDGEYASAVLEAWRDEVAARDERDDVGDGRGASSVLAPLVYGRAADGASLHGHIYRRRPPPLPKTNDGDL